MTPQQGITALRAYMNGVWDNPDLQKVGYLHINAKQVIGQILDMVVDEPVGILNSIIARSDIEPEEQALDEALDDMGRMNLEPEERFWKNMATWNERHADSDDDGQREIENDQDEY